MPSRTSTSSSTTRGTSGAITYRHAPNRWNSCSARALCTRSDASLPIAVAESVPLNGLLSPLHASTPPCLRLFLSCPPVAGSTQLLPRRRGHAGTGEAADPAVQGNEQSGHRSGTGPRRDEGAPPRSRAPDIQGNEPPRTLFASRSSTVSQATPGKDVLCSFMSMPVHHAHALQAVLAIEANEEWCVRDASRPIMPLIVTLCL